ncbi:hypothetical protein FHX08_001281 [Rhizobium sp. BK529]|nr:hypothetical protein [Rhizobium sp. BK529]TCS09110.1 hypothetical protein EV281_101991 [Rhizobium sp. BK418]
MRAFQSSGKTRLNANGRKLDAWLIYKCLTCDKTWNRPLFERQNVRDIDPATLEALQSNDVEWIRMESFNLDALKRKSQRIDEFPEFDIARQVMREAVGWTRLEIELLVPLPASIRLDRLLACELKFSRTRLQTLHEKGLLQVSPDRADILRRRIRSGTEVTIDLATTADRKLSWGPLATGSPR